MPLECFGRDGLLDGNRTHISRLGGACTIHYATRRSGRILARRGAQPPVLWTTTTIKRLWLVLLVLFGMKVALADEVPAVGSVAPPFALADQDGKTVALDGLRNQWPVLYFYPKNDTPGRTEEACSFRDDRAEINRLGAQVVAVSIDSSATNTSFARNYHLPFPLLADSDGAVARRYGASSD